MTLVKKKKRKIHKHVLVTYSDKENTHYLYFFFFFPFLFFFFIKYVTISNIDLRIRTLFDRILQLLSSTQPPETASGATLVQCIAQLNIKNLSELINSDEKKTI